MAPTTRATVGDLYRVPGKAELVDGQLRVMEPTGDMPGVAGGVIFASLRAHARSTGTGIAFPDNVGFLVNLPNRQSFSPDAAFYTGPRGGMKFLQGAPAFAADTPAPDPDLAPFRQAYTTGSGLAYVVVKDTGIGMSPEERERAFDYAFRGTGAIASGRPGRGLGLAVSREILEANGGKISLTSDAGFGSEVTILLPFGKGGR